MENHVTNSVNMINTTVKYLDDNSTPFEKECSTSLGVGGVLGLMFFYKAGSLLGSNARD